VNTHKAGYFSAALFMLVMVALLSPGFAKDHSDGMDVLR
jgi:hypothetical protein